MPNAATGAVRFLVLSLAASISESVATPPETVRITVGNQHPQDQNPYSIFAGHIQYYVRK